MFTPLLGFELLEDSRWAGIAAVTLFAGPLYWLTTYYLCAFLFGSNWLYLVGSQLLVISGRFEAPYDRLALLPLVLLLLAAFLRKAAGAGR